MKTINRMPAKGAFLGVCAGLAYSFGMPTWVARMVFAVLTLCLGFPLLLYFALAIFMPSRADAPDDYEARINRWFEDAPSSTLR